MRLRLRKPQVEVWRMRLRSRAPRPAIPEAGLADAAAVAGASTRSETVAVAAAAVWSAPTTSLYGEPQADAAVAVEASGVAVGMLALGGGLKEKYEGKKQVCLEYWLDQPPPKASSPDGAHGPLLSGWRCLAE